MWAENATGNTTLRLRRMHQGQGGWHNNIHNSPLQDFVVSSTEMWPTPAERTGTASQKTEKVMDACMPRGRNYRRPPIYWWTEDVAALRRICIRVRRLYQRSRGRKSFDQLREEFRISRCDLQVALKLSKRRCLNDLYEEVNAEPWGRPCKIVMGKLISCQSRPSTFPRLLQPAVETLFPQQYEYRKAHSISQDDTGEPITREELLRV